MHPSAKRPNVGGRYGLSDTPLLVVRVASPAADGKANEAVLEALATAFGVRRQDARLVSGARNRTKVVEIDGADPRILTALLLAN